MPKAKAAPAKKAAKGKKLADKPAPKTKAIKKTEASTKTEPKASAAKKSAVAPKKNAVKRKDSKRKTLDLCLILDCTSSMGMWIERSKDTLHSIIDHVKAENEGLTVRVGFVAYRDFCDGKDRLDVTDFTTDIDAIKKKIQD